jgi:hypothetical protein
MGTPLEVLMEQPWNYQVTGVYEKNKPCFIARNYFMGM